METEKCFRCGNKFSPIEGYYNVPLGVTFCKACGDKWVELVIKHTREEQEFFTCSRKGKEMKR